MSAFEDIAPGFEPRRLYFHRRTHGWEWHGEQRYWEIYVEFADGYNGVGGALITEHWRWNGSQYSAIEKQHNLSYSETKQLLDELRAANGMEEEPCTTFSIE